MDLFDTYSEEWRMECEAKYVLSKPLKERKLYLADVQEKRGLNARLQLEAEILRLWKNR